MRIELPISLTPDEAFALFGIVIKENATHVCLDSRMATVGDLFFSLADNRHHITEALEKGAFYAGNRTSLGLLASFVREKLNPTVIAITGSVGKTTAKEYVYAALSSRIKTHKTSENNNNDIGVPISILTMPKDTQALVLELGSNNPGEIEYLSGICKPDIAVITSIGTSHIGRFGSQKAIAREKLSILRNTAESGYFIHPASLCIPKSFSCRQKEITVGAKGEMCDFAIESIRLGDVSEYTANGIAVSLPSRSIHSVTASAIALAVCEAAGVGIKENFSFISRVDMLKMRQNIYCRDGIWFFDDCYNSSIESIDAALTLMSSIAREKGLRRVVILGDILECGEYAKKIHEDTGVLCAKRGVDVLIAYGEDSVYTAAAALGEGMGQDKVFFIGGKSHRSVASVASSVIRSGDIILFKASRGMECEKIIDYIKEEIY